MRSYRVVAGSAVAGLLVWACSSGTESTLPPLVDAGGVTEDAIASEDAAIGDDDASGLGDSAAATDANVSGDAAIVDAGSADAKSDSGVLDSEVVDSGVVDSGVKGTYTVGGTVSGLVGTVVLQNKGGDNKTITANGTYTFGTKLDPGETYSVAILTQPDGQYCSLVNKTGTIVGSSVANVNVSCVAPSNCKTIHAFEPSAPSGIYIIDPDTAGALPPMNVYCDMTTAGGGWTQVFDHATANGYRASDQWASVNPTLPNSGLYSILDLLSNLKSAANYEFYLTWLSGNPNCVGKSAQWTQVQNPTAVSDPTAVTISGVTLTPANQTGIGAFSGLAKKITASAFLSGERSSYFYWAVGTSGVFSDGPYLGIPSYSAGGAASRSQLFVR